MEVRICALPICDNFIPVKSFKLGSYPGEYCCHDCVNEAFMLKKAGKPFHKDLTSVITTTEKENHLSQETNVPHVRAEDFGDASIIRRFCDNTTCKNPGKNPTFEVDGRIMTMITMCWKGRNGEFCSNDCLKTEKENKSMKNVTATPEEVEDSPVSAGAPASGKKKGKKAVAKKATKKAAAKKAAAKKAPAKAAGTGVPRSKYANEAVITVKKTDHEYKGKRAEALALLLKNGQTVEKFKEALAKKEAAGNDRLSTYSGWALSTAIEAGLVTVK